MKHRRIIVAMLACLALTACDEFIERDGAWTPMKWSHDKYETVKLEGVTYYRVPIEGGDYVFCCKNYKAPWLSDHMFEVDGETYHSYQDPMSDYELQFRHYDNGWCRIDAVKDTIKVSFEANNGRARKATIGVTAGDIFHRFRFIQQAASYTESGDR